MPYFSADSDLSRIRSGVEKYLGKSIPDWKSYHAEAGHRLVSDLRATWFPSAARSMATTETFDPKKILAGWEYFSADGNVGQVVPSDRVYVSPGHTSGGTPGNVYEFGGTAFESSLSLVNYTSSDWEDVTEWQEAPFRDLAAYWALHLVYRFLVTDSGDPKTDPFAGHRDYFEKKYKDEFQHVMEVGGVPYDWDGDLVITPEESRPTRTRLRALW